MMIDDSGIVMNKKHLTPCLTKYWRRLYDFDSSLPPKCTECLESLYNVYGFMQQVQVHTHTLSLSLDILE